tara:strand:- start:717 stop:941 length:225 start_codon:yes stop_codon:yes gene_type:complete
MSQEQTAPVIPLELSVDQYNYVAARLVSLGTPDGEKAVEIMRLHLSVIEVLRVAAERVQAPQEPQEPQEGQRTL